MMRTLVLAASLYLLAGCQEPTQFEIADQSLRPARVMTISLANEQQKVELVGRVEAAQAIDLAFEVSGPLSRVAVREGQSIAKGTLLATLDPSEFLLAVQESKIQLRLAEQDLDRKQRVLAQRAIARSVVDDARSIRDLQRVRLEQARKKLSDATLVAPFDGLVAERYIDGFTNISAGQPILRLHAGNELHITANLPEQMSASLNLSDVERIYCRFAFAGDEQFPLTFRENRGEADRVAQTIEVSFAMPRPQAWNLVPGMTATVTLELQTSLIASVVLPPAAVVADAEQRLFVWLVDEGDYSISRRYIEVDRSTAKGFVVVGGLADGDVIITTGAATLSAGTRVRPLADAKRV